MKRFLRTDASWVSLFQRLVLAAVIFPHGAQKLFGWWGGHGFTNTIQFFDGMGIPVALAVIVILTESLGAVALALGLVTRLAALGIASIMVGAIALVHWKVGFFMNWTGQQGGEGFEYHLLALGLAIPLIVRGGGLASIDGAIVRGFGPPTTKPESYATSR
jgi:putative oxidoreductase